MIPEMPLSLAYLQRETARSERSHQRRCEISAKQRSYARKEAYARIIVGLILLLAGYAISSAIS